MKFVVCVEPDENGAYVAGCPALPGCASQGETVEHAMANIQEAIEGVLAVRRKHGLPPVEGAA